LKVDLQVAIIKMDYHSMSLIELKQLAKEHRPRIKQYYIKTRVELIQILSMKELPESFRIAKLTIAELRKEAKERGLNVNIWTLRKKELVDLLYPSSQENHKDDDGGKKHDDPQKSESQDVRV
jgi:hypothetical protein